MSDTNISNEQLQSLEERQEQSLKQIQELQDVEKQLYKNLETTAASNNDNALENQEQIINRINELSNIRMNMYSNLKDMYGFLQSNVAESRSDLVDQTAIVGIVEEELNNAKGNINALRDAKNNKLRMVEINTYFSKRYEAHSDIMKAIIIICVPLLILGILTSRNLIPGNLGAILSGIVIVIALFYIGRKVVDVWMRDNMNYDEYNFAFNPKDMSPSVMEYDQAHIKGLKTDMGGSCIGQECCAAGTKWDETKSACVEGFNTGQLTQGCFNSDSKVTLKDGEVRPNDESESNYARI